MASSALLVVAVTGCDGSGDGSVVAPRKALSACETLIGREGVEWAEAAAPVPVEESTQGRLDLAKAERWYQSSAYAWDPSKADKTHMSIDPPVCEIGPVGAKVEARSVEISYGGSISGFDKLESGSEQLGEGVRVISVNQDVRLVLWTGTRDETLRSVHVRCKVPQTPEGQEDGMPLQGMMSDSLTNDRDDKNRLTYLLRSAHVVVEAFDCENHPTVPTQLPDGWRSG
ncbi:hypothetical protein [Streptomyces chilikensis]|uniref:hypothetical protein n=1 Tax=Streptomyces chilikensis TaxID=1194079 RepID=UPI001409E48F|nr:hypothetical protein [Streptomyces chilikensis]